MRFGVLGPVIVDRGETSIGGPRQRRLLAALLADAGRVVSTDRLSEIVFEGEPTDAAAVTLRSYVARLRRSLDGSDATVSTRAPGYVIELGDSDVDAREFEANLGEARRHLSEGRAGDALDRVTAGLALWRGPAYAEFADEAWIQPEAIRLDELRIEAEELRLACLLDLGRHADAAPDLASLVDREPLREGARTLLMTALYRSGRQADALRAADAFRHELAELGLVPSGDFDELERRIAVQDPDLRIAPPSGRVLRGYRLVKRLGDDDVVVVHTAIQPGIEREVVVTSYGPTIADEERFIRAFEITVQKVAKLDHPGLVEILDYWREPGAAHVVTRLARDGDLSTLMAKGPLGVELVTDVVTDVAAALDLAHAQGLWHGRLTSGDVLFDDDAVLVAGVGTADIVGAIRDGHDAASPDEPGPARDQLALAALAHRALTGVLPPEGALGLAALPPVSTMRPELLSLDGVLARAGARHPEDRYSTIGAFAHSFAVAVGHGAADIAPGRALNPYKGLSAFTEADEADFHGRERLVEELVDRVGRTRFVAVVGPSGSGKSSVVRAGVVARVRASGSRLVATMVPGAAPFVELTRALRAIAPLEGVVRLDATLEGVLEVLRSAVAGAPLLLVIDQFEELYTLVDDDTERLRFIDGLMDAVEDAALDLRIVITLRADFFDRPLQHHRLGVALADGAVPIPAMSPAEIERAVVEPATSAGVSIDGAVVAELVATTIDQPAGLPLLEFSLTELFESRRSNDIAISDYERLGGVAGAIAGRAERLYDDATAAEREVIRTVFLRLITVGSGAADLRRRTDRAELVSAGPDAETTRRVIERFGAARLLAFDRNPASRAPTVEVAHEALLRHWPRLRAWVDEAGRDLVLRAHLTAAAATWEASGRDDGDLYRGARLVDTEDWSNRADLTDSEHDFLSESLARRRAEEKAERARLDEQTRANRRLRRALAAVGAVLVVALVAGFLAIGQRNRARAETARAEESRANALAVTADEHVSSDRSLALLLAVEAALVDTSDRTTSVLLAAISGDNLPYTRTVIPTPAAAYSAMALTPDGAIAVAKRRDGLIDIVDITTRQVVVAGLFGPPSPVRGVDVSDDGRYAVVSGEDSDGTAAVVYSLPGGAEMARIASRIEGTIHQAVFAAGTNEVVVGDALGVLSIHDPLTGAAKGMIDTATGSEITALDVDGRTMFVADVPEIGFGLSSYVSAWDLDTGEPVVERREIDANFVVAILARDGLVYTAGAGAPVQLYDGATLDLIADDLDGPSQGGTAITSLDVAPDGSLAMGSEDGIEIRPPDDAPVEYVALPGGQAPGVAFTPDGGTLVSADSEGTISTWRLGVIEDLGVPLVPEGPGLVTVSPGGDRLAVWARGRGVQLFDLETLDHIGALESLGPDDSFLAFDFDSEGRTILTMTCPVEQEDHCDAVVALFDVGSMRRIAGPAPVGSLGADISQGAMLTADGSMVAVVSPGNTVRLLDVPSLEPVGDPLQLRDVSVGAGPEGLQVATGSRNGRSLVAAIGVFGQTVVWDITDDPAPLGTIAGVATALSFSPEGTLTVGYATGIVEVWDPIAMTRNGEPLSGPGITWRVDVAETGILLASSLEGSTRLWDLETRRALSGDLTSWGAALDLEGTRLFLGALGAPIGGVRVATLSLDVNDLLAEACRRAGRNLTVEEWTTYMPSDLEHRATCPEWPLQST